MEMDMRPPFHSGLAVCLIFALGSLIAACQNKAEPSVLAQLEARVKRLEERLETLKPGLGDIMLGVQQHHIKLWYAGLGRRWGLARFELKEIAESFDEAEKLYPEFEGVAVGNLIPASTQQAMAELARAIDGQNPARFGAAYDALSLACSNCHRGAKRPFITMQRPTPGQFSDQVFHP